MLDEKAHILNENELSDLKFSLATSYVLEGSPELLDPAKVLFKEALAYENPLYQGFILNNLGMTNFYSFVIGSQSLTDP